MIDRNDLTGEMEELIACAGRCFERGLQTNSGGNLSVLLPAREAIIIKPSGVGFNECSPDNLQIVHLDGRVEHSAYRPSKDLGFHLGLYRVRKDIRAIVHCHSPWATGYASAGLGIPCLTVQAKEKLGEVPLIPLPTGGGAQTDADISPVFRNSATVAAVLANHGQIGVGKSLMAAQHVAELIEETAHIAWVRDMLTAPRA